jgi:transcriptional regulator with XRE-family HTH domain
MTESATPIRPENRLRELREAAGERLEEVAVDLGVTKEAVARWERGQIPAQRLRLLASRYGVSISYLLRDGHEEAA